MAQFSALENGVVEDTFDFPKRQRRLASGRAKGKDLKMLFVINGPDVWTRFGDSPANRTDNYAPERSEHPLADFSPLPRIVEEDADLSIVRTEEIEGREAIVVRATAKGGFDLDLAIDKQSGLLVRAERQATLPDSPDESKMVTLLSDYRLVDGWRYPMRIRGFRDGKPFLDIAISDLRFLKTVDDKEFEKP
jgi:hypothetical protein